MAKIVMKGLVADVELATGFDGGVTADCIDHRDHKGEPKGCNWGYLYSDWNDATEYAADHADFGKV